MKKFNPLYGLLIVPALLLVGCTNTTTDTTPAPTETTTAEAPQEKTATINAAPVEVQNILGADLLETAQASGKFVEYSEATLNGLAEAGQSHVIFFHANWCSWCRAREQEILENINTLPANTKIIKANFDEESALKRTYGVTTKDTFVFIDGEGKATLKNGASMETITDFFNNNVVASGEERPNGVAGYFEYDADVVENFKGNKPFALFFHASWCPPCRALDADIKANLATVPKNTNIFKVDYDSSTELKKLYGITQQHTVVFFDKDGNVADTKSGVSLDDITPFFE